MTANSMSKGGLEQVTKALSNEWASDAIGLQDRDKPDDQ